MTTSQIVDSLLEDYVDESVVQAAPKPEIRILPAEGEEHHHDIMLISDHAPVYIGTICPKANHWKPTRTPPTVSRHMRAQLHFTAPTKDECALRIAEVMKPFWEPIIAGHGPVEESVSVVEKLLDEAEYSPKQFIAQTLTYEERVRDALQHIGLADVCVLPRGGGGYAAWFRWPGEGGLWREAEPEIRPTIRAVAPIKTFIHLSGTLFCQWTLAS